MTRPAKFRQPELTRAIRGALKAGANVSGAEINPDGTIRVLFEKAAPETPSSALDEWKMRHGTW